MQADWQVERTSHLALKQADWHTGHKAGRLRGRKDITPGIKVDWQVKRTSHLALKQADRQVKRTSHPALKQADWQVEMTSHLAPSARHYSRQTGR